MRQLSSTTTQSTFCFLSLIIVTRSTTPTRSPSSPSSSPRLASPPPRRIRTTLFVVVALFSPSLHSASAAHSDRRAYATPSLHSIPAANMSGTTEPTPTSSIPTAPATDPTMNGYPSTGAKAEEAGLFGDDLISPDVAAALPQGYKIRALRQSDYDAGFLDCLRVLTTVGDITADQFAERFEWIRRQDGSYYVLVIEDGGRVVGTGALIAERKL